MGIGSQRPRRRPDQHHRMRAVAVADVAKQREGDREQDALFDADGHDGDGGDDCEMNSPGLSRRIPCSPLMSIIASAT